MNKTYINHVNDMNNNINSNNSKNANANTNTNTKNTNNTNDGAPPGRRVARGASRPPCAGPRPRRASARPGGEAGGNIIYYNTI